MIISAADFYKWLQIFNVQTGSDPSLTFNDIYTNSNPAVINLISGKPFGFISTEEGIYDPSMTSTQFDAIVSPVNGLHAWANDLNRPVYNVGTPGSPERQVGAYLSDLASVTADGAIGECYFNGNNTATVMVDTVTPIKVAGTYVSGPILVNMSHANGTLTNTGTEILNLKLTVSMTVSLDLANGDIEGYIYLNGITSLANVIQQISLDDTSPSFKTIVLSGYITLAPGEFAEVFILNTTAADDITVKSLNFSLNTVGAVAPNTSGNFLLGVCTVPTTSYTFGAYSSVIQSFNGTQTIPANSLAIGQSVELMMSFNINPVLPTQPSVAGNFRFTFGSIVLTTGVNDIILTNSASRKGELRYTVTRVDIGTVQIDVTGSYVDSTVTYRSLYPAPLFGGPTFAYNAGLDALIDVEWRTNVGDGANLINIVARNLRIVKFA